MNNKLLIICGPTASGKTALAVECAKILNTEIISADSAQVYKKLNIGTAKPSAEEMREIKHHMIDVAGPAEDFSVSKYKSLAMPVIKALQSKNKIPIICGGTGYYIKALLYNYSYGGTNSDKSLKEKLYNTAKEKGELYLHNTLSEIDPESAKQIHPSNLVRVVRALEIYYLTGKKKSEQKDKESSEFDFTAACINYDREVLYQRINSRVELMLKNGLVNEVKSLLESGVSESCQSMHAIGYKEIVECLKNGNLHSIMSDTIKQNTRNYAKRQVTYFKKLQNLVYFQPQNDIKALAKEVIGTLHVSKKIPL